MKFWTRCFGWYTCLLLYVHVYEMRIDALFCRPLNWEYYRQQVKDCGHCEPCVKGEEKVTMEEYDVKMGKYGATRCLPCKTCRKGTYSDKHSHKCSKCTNCTDQELAVVRPCTHLQDTECGPPRRPKNDESSTTAKNQRDDVSFTEDRSNDFPLKIGFGVLLTVLVVILTYCLIQWWKRKHKNRPTSQDKGVRREQSDKIEQFVKREDIDLKKGTQEDEFLIEIDQNSVRGDMDESICPSSEFIYTRTRLQDVQEEPLQETIDCVVVSPSNHRDTDINSTVDEKSKLIPKIKRQRKRHVSCSLDYYSSNNYGAILDTFVDGDGKQAKADAASINKRLNGRCTKPAFQRQVSVPVTWQEHTEAPEMTLDKPDEPPSVDFKTYLSKMTAANKLYKSVALEVGVDENTVNIIEEDFKNESCQEVAYLVIKKMSEKLVSKRSIYNCLEKKIPKEVLKLKIREIKTIH